MTRFTGRKALVTGAAGGIGAAIVTRLLSEGAMVVGIDRDAAPTSSVAPLWVSADLQSPAAARAAVEGAVEALGGAPDVVVSAAGIYALAPATAIEEADWNLNQDINLRAPFFVAQAAIAARDAARLTTPMAIVNIASVGAYRAGTGDAALSYQASKAGLIALTRSMAAEWARRSIRVNVVSPGVIDTSMVRIMDDPASGQAWLDARVPMARLGRPDEIAAVVCFLASDEASYVTGAELIADGGYMCV